MRGVKSENLIAIVDFLYCGEANVCQENLDAFLALAEELRLNGLRGQTENAGKKVDSTYPTPGQIYKKEKSNTEGRQLYLEPNLDAQPAKIQTNTENRIAIPNFESENYLQELDEKIKSMMETSENSISSRKGRAKICKLCGKECQGINIRDHFEANHLEGVSLPCNLCEKTFRTRMSLRLHKCTRY